MRSSCHYTGSACCVMCVRKGETEQPCAYCLTSYRPVRCVSMWPCTKLFIEPTVIPPLAR